MSQEQSKDVDFRVNEMFDVGPRHLLIRSADGFEAVIRETSDPVYLWLLRHPVSQGGEGAERLASRMTRIAESGAAVLKLKAFGIDSDGRAFVAVDRKSGKTVSECSVKDDGALLKIFHKMVEIVAKLHEAQLPLGDLCDGSFVVTDDGAVFFTVSLSGFEVEAEKTSYLPPGETLPYLPPDQNADVEPEHSADVYALGVLAYRLFTGKQLPTGKAENDPPSPVSVRNQLPRWLNDIVGLCLEPKGIRYATAIELLSAIDRAQVSGLAPRTGGRWAHNSVAVRAQQGEGADGKKKEVSKSSNRKKIQAELPKKKNRSWMLGAFAFFCALVVIGAIGYLFVAQLGDKPNPLREAFAEYVTRATPELKRLLSDFSAPEVSGSARLTALKEMSASADPVADEVLVFVASQLTNNSQVNLRHQAENSFIERLRGRGWNHLANMLSEKFSKIREQQQDPLRIPNYEILLRAGVAGLSPKQRVGLLEQLSATDQIFGAQIAAAIALDAQEEPAYLNELQSLVGKLNPRAVNGKPTIGVLLLAHPALTQFVSGEIREDVKKFSTEELSWLMAVLAEQDSVYLPDVVAELGARQQFQPYSKVFFQALTSEGAPSLAKDVKRALVKGLQSHLAIEDIPSFGRWWSVDSERVLLTVCASSEDAALRLEAFDTLAARSLTTQPAAALVDWIKESAWDNRAGLVQAVGVLGINDVAPQEDIAKAIDSLIALSVPGIFLDVMIDAGSANLIVSTLEKIGNLAQSQKLLKLLSSSDKRVRIAAVKALSGRNELDTLQGISKGYENETDPEVRKVYEEIHWVVRKQH